MPKPVPSAPVKDFSFTTFGATNPTTPPPGQQLDQEFNRTNDAVKKTIDFVRQAVADDGRIKAEALTSSIIGPEGPAGPQGPIGPEGPAGPQGPIGPAGPQGADGPQGIQGPAGQSFVPDMVGPAAGRAAYDDAPASFAYLDATNGWLYFKLTNTSADWSAPVYFGRGLQGPQGIQGIQGPQGPAGEQGPAGPQGPVGDAGPQGPQGVAGSMVRYGVGAPDNALGNNGDIYFDAAGGVYTKAAGVWTLATSIIGPEGAQGPIGLTGAQGVQGEVGPQGPAGPTGPVGPPGEVSQATLDAAIASANSYTDTALASANSYTDTALAGIDMSTKADLDGPTFTGTVTLPATTSIGAISAAELGYLDGVTSSIQTQLNSKVSASGVPTAYAGNVGGLGIGAVAVLYQIAANTSISAGSSYSNLRELTWVTDGSTITFAAAWTSNVGGTWRALSNGRNSSGKYSIATFVRIA